ncbi:hypothetical protein SELMODRAFT_409456 [Selaginella moellendorffii]|uniref:Uncharacterized protein n=1 Tax=Selaginella moellendorffii TaxID=88036 RepID=D8RBI3_SELML|nr:hypothetical protein SELMODRAFT_409456 [Selaginella moellendorffii]
MLPRCGPDLVSREFHPLDSHRLSLQTPKFTDARRAKSVFLGPFYPAEAYQLVRFDMLGKIKQAAGPNQIYKPSTWTLAERDLEPFSSKTVAVCEIVKACCSTTLNLEKESSHSIHHGPRKKCKRLNQCPGTTRVIQATKKANPSHWAVLGLAWLFSNSTPEWSAQPDLCSFLCCLFLEETAALNAFVTGLVLVLAPKSSLGARMMMQDESSMITGSARDLTRQQQQQQEWMVMEGAADDWDETELEIDGAGEDFPQERPHSFFHADRDSPNRF